MAFWSPRDGRRSPAKTTRTCLMHRCPTLCSLGARGSGAPARHSRVSATTASLCSLSDWPSSRRQPHGPSRSRNRRAWALTCPHRRANSTASSHHARYSRYGCRRPTGPWCVHGGALLPKARAPSAPIRGPTPPCRSNTCRSAARRATARTPRRHNARGPPTGFEASGEAPPHATARLGWSGCSGRRSSARNAQTYRLSQRPRDGTRTARASPCCRAPDHSAPTCAPWRRPPAPESGSSRSRPGAP
mmetsp:Transcript_96690/g.279125  ORF Transcript_96690/g.279125 Transcript_96690/m.279125 type:complete len:246 (-) Transcript_96690:988-1725(-)